MKKERISVQLGKMTKDSLTRIAAVEGYSISQLAAKAIKNYIRYYSKEIYPTKYNDFKELDK